MTNPLISVRRRKKIIDRHKKERTIVKYLGTFSLRELRHNKYGKKYVNLNIKTELDLVVFLKDVYGTGEYTVMGHKKGVLGGYVFWKGSITDEGWIFNTKETYAPEDKRMLEMFNKQLLKAQTVEEELDIKLDIQETKSSCREISKIRRYGFVPYLLPISKRGQINFWDMPSRLIESNIIDSTKGVENTVPITIVKNKDIIPKSKIAIMNLDEVNSNFRN